MASNRKRFALIQALLSSNNTSNNTVSIENKDDSVVKLSIDDKHVLKVDTSGLNDKLTSLKPSRKCIIGIRFTLGKIIICPWGDQRIEQKHLSKYDGQMSITFPYELVSSEYSINITSNIFGIVGYSNTSKTGLTLITYLPTGGKSTMNTNLEINLEIFL